MRKRESSCNDDENSHVHFIIFCQCDETKLTAVYSCLLAKTAT